MAFSTFVGSFAVQAATGNFAITGVGFQPKAILFWGTKLTADGNNNNVGGDIPSWWGMAISSASRMAMVEGDDGVTSNAVSSDATKCIKCITGASTVTFAADFVTFGADGFTVNFTTANGTAYIVNYMALGGADLTDVFIKSFTSGAATGNQATTGVGFRPDLIYLMGADNGNSNNALGFGFGKTTVQRGSMCTGSNASTEARVLRTNRVYTMLDGTAVRCEADFISLDSDGFTLNWVTASTDTHTIYALCLKGGNYTVGSFLERTGTPGSQSVTGVGFAPKGLFSFGAILGGGDPPTGNQCISTAAASDATHRAVVQYAGPNFGMSAMTRTGVVMAITRIAGYTTLSFGDLSQFDTDGFTFSYGTVSATTAFEHIYLAFGDQAGMPLLGQAQSTRPTALPTYGVDVRRSSGLRTFTQSTPLNLLGQDAHTAGASYTVPPRHPQPALTYPTALRTWTNNNLQNTLQSDNQPDPFKSVAWQQPPPARLSTQLRTWTQNLLQSTLTPAATVNPFVTELFPLPNRVRYRAPLYQWEQYVVVDENVPPVGAIDRVPGGRVYPVSLRTWTINLLQSTLAPAPVVNPFLPPLLPNPRGAARSVSLLTWIQPIVGSVTTTALPPPNPLVALPIGRPYPPALRTWSQNLQQSTLAPAESTATFFNPPPINPRGREFPISLRTWIQTPRLTDEPRVPLPVLEVPAGYRRSISLLTIGDDGRLCLRGGGTPVTGGGSFRVNVYLGVGNL